MAVKYIKVFNPEDGTVSEFGPQGWTKSAYVPPSSSGGGGLFGAISDAVSSIAAPVFNPIIDTVSKVATDIFQPVEKTVTQNLAQLDKDLSLSQNAPLIAAIALSVAAPGVGSAIGQQMIAAGLLPAATSAAAATAIGTGVANAALQVAQGKSPEAALKAGIVGAAGGTIGSYLIGDPGTLNNFVSSTSANLLAGKNPEDAVKSGIISSSAGFAGGTAAQATDSALVGQLTAGTTAGLLSGKTGEQALLQGVGSINVGSIIPDDRLNKAIDTGKSGDFLGQLNQLRDIVGLDRYESINDYYKQNGITPPEVTVANETQVTAGQQDLTNQLADFEAVTTSAIDLNKVATVANEAQVINDQTGLQDSLATFLTDTTASAFDKKDIIDDGSGFGTTTTTAQEIIDSGVINAATDLANVAGTDVTKTEAVTNLNEDLISSSGTDAAKTDTTETIVNTGENIMGDDDEVIDFEGAGMSADLREYLADPEGATMYKDIQRELNLDPEGAGMSADLSKAIDDYSKGTGLTLDKVIKLFKSNPNLVKAATSLVTGGVGLFGTKLAKDTADAAAKAAAEAMKFKPVGVTTRFGTTDYTYDAEGNLKTAGYTLTPDLKAIQDKLMSGATLSLDEAKKVADLYDPLKKASSSLFDLGTSYLAKTPEQVASDYMAKQQDLLAPSRERQMSQLQNTLFQQGRGGLSVGATSARPSGARGLGATTPEMEAYYNALAQSDAGLATRAQEAGQQSVLFGKGLLGAGGEFLGKYTAGQTGAYDPFKSLLASAGTVESMGAGALDVGTELGGRRTTAAGNAALTLKPSASVNPYSSLFTSLADDPEFKAAVQSFLGN